MGGHTMDVDKLDDFDNWFGAIHDQTGNDNPATTTAQAENVSTAPSKKIAAPAKRVRPRPGGGGAAERLMSGQSIMDSAGMSERLAEARMRVQKAKEEKQNIADRSNGRRRRTKESITRFLDSLDDDDGLGARSSHGNRRGSLDRSRPTLRSDPLGASSHTASRARDPLGASSHHANMRRRGSNDSDISSGQSNTYSRMRRRGSNESDIPSGQSNNYSTMRRRASNESEAPPGHHNGAVSDRSTSSRMTGRVSLGDESGTSQASNGKDELNVSRRPRKTRNSSAHESEESQGPPVGSQERRLSSGAEYEQPDETSGGSNPQSGSMSGRNDPTNADEKLSELGMKVSVSPSSDDGTVLVQMDKETLSRLLENAGIDEDSVVPVTKPKTRSVANERPEPNNQVEHINSDNEIELKSSDMRSDEKSSNRKSDHLRSSRHGSKSSSHGDDGSRDAANTDRRRQMHRKESHRRMERSETNSDEVPTTDRGSQSEKGASRRRAEARDDGTRDISSSRHHEGIKVKIPNKDRRSQLERGTSRRRVESKGEGISSSRHHDGIKVKVPNTDRRSQLERGSSRRRVESKGDGSRDISSSRHRESSHSSKDPERRRRSSSQGPLSTDRRTSRSESSSSSAPRRSRSTSRARHPDGHKSSSSRGESRTRRRDSSRTRSSGSESNGDKVSKRETANDNTGTPDRRAQLRRVTSSREVESQPRRVRSVGSQPISSSLHSDQLAQRGGAIPARKPLDRRAMMMRSCSNPVLVKRKTETDVTGKMGDLHF